MADQAARIVIVEDEGIVAKDIQRTLENLGYGVPARFASGEAAIEKIDELRPDLVLMDIMLRGSMDGITAAHLIRDRWDIPVVYLTAHADSATLQRAKISEPFGYILKPFEERDLHTTVEMALYKHEMDRKLRQNERWLAVTLSSIGDGVIATDAHGRVVFFNRVAESLTGWTSAEAVGRPLSEVFHIINEHTRRAVENPVARVLETGRTVGLANHTLLVARDGTERPIDDSGAPIRVPEGDVLGTVLVFRDVTEKKRLERELQRRADELAVIDRRKDEFLAMLGHELRNPLAAMHNGIEVLKQVGSPGDEAQEMRDLIERQVKHMRALVDDLLDVARITRGKVSLRKERLDLTAVVRQVTEEHKRGIESQGSVLRVALSDDCIWCQADATRLAQVMTNLLTNALKFMDQPGEIAVELRHDPERGVATIQVRDTGIGMDRQMLENLFQPFVQAERSLGRSQGGLGLGLALVKKLVELHGGQVSADSAGPGKGSQFTIELPTAEPQNPGEPSQSAARGAGRSRRVVVIDDHQDAILSVRRMLELSGHEVFVAHDGPDGISLVREIRPEVVLCDIGLPGGLSGFDVAAAIRAETDLREVYLVAISGYGQQEDRQRAQDAGFDYHLTKPASGSDLEGLLSSLPRF